MILLQRLQRPPVQVALGLLAPLVLCALLSLVKDSVTTATDALLIVLVVVAVASTGSRVGGVLAALSGAAWFDFFLTEPFNTFTINDSEDVEIAVLLVVIGIAVSELALWGRRQQEGASVRAGYLNGVLQAADAIALHDAPPDALAVSVAKQIRAVLEVGDCRFVSGPYHDTRYAVLQHDGTVVRQGGEVDVLRDGLPLHEQTVLPVRDQDVTLGHFLLTSSTRTVRPSHEQLRVAVLLADQMGAVLHRA